jgi:hypothetical protein
MIKKIILKQLKNKKISVIDKTIFSINELINIIKKNNILTLGCYDNTIIIYNIYKNGVYHYINIDLKNSNTIYVYTQKKYFEVER